MSGYQNTETGKRILARDFTVSNDTFATQLNNNDLIIGPSGAGKTSGYVKPNICQYDTSMIVADTKCSLSNELRDDLIKNGYKIYTVDFVNPENSSAYNPLDYIRKNPVTGKYREQDILTISNALVKTDVKDPFWSDSARIVITCLISFVLEAFPDDDPNLNKVVCMYNVLVSQRAKHKENEPWEIPFLEDWALLHPDSFAIQKYHMFKSVLGVNTTWSCITQFVTNALSPFEFEEAKALFAQPTDFKLGDLGKEKIVVFLNVSDSDRTFDDLVNLFYTQALQALISEADKQPHNRLRVPVRLILDDFAANACIPDFDKTIAVIRSRAVSVSIILQSLTQLNSMYSHPTAMTIINNCDHVIYLGGSDRETAEYVAYRVDKSVQTVLSTPLDKVWIMERGRKGVLRDRYNPFVSEN